LIELRFGQSNRAMLVYVNEIHPTFAKRHLLQRARVKRGEDCQWGCCVHNSIRIRKALGLRVLVIASNDTREEIRFDRARRILQAITGVIDVDKSGSSTPRTIPRPARSRVLLDRVLSASTGPSSHRDFLAAFAFFLAHVWQSSQFFLRWPTKPPQ